jgi:hypothetical protein
VKEELNKAIQNELKLRDFAGELLQRISATHRQCEADLRKILVETKMNTLANIIDINHHSANPGAATILVQIEQVAAKIQTDMSLEQRELLHSNCSKNQSWNEILTCWSGCSCPPLPPVLASQSSVEKKIFDQFVLTQTRVSTDSRENDDLKIFEYGCNSSSPRDRVNSSPRVTSSHNDVLSEGVVPTAPLSDSTFIRPIKHIYKSPESESIRLAIKDLVAKQLETCSADDAPNYSKVLIPVLQGMSGYVCGRLPSEAKKAISAYSEGALGDQVRIMRCLVTIFLSFTQKSTEGGNDEPPPSVEIPSTSDPSLGDGFKNDIKRQGQPQQEIATNENLHLVSCSHVEDFLYWASSIGDIISLQVRRPSIATSTRHSHSHQDQAVRLVTELIHSCLCRRMKDRILEQCEILPLQTQSGDRLVSEFEREIAHGIYSRKRLVILLSC